MHTIGIVGPGQMGTGISQLCAGAGFRVLLIGRDAARVARAKNRIEASLSRLVDKGKLLPEQQAMALQLIEPGVDYAALHNADFIIESVREHEAAKAATLEAISPFLQNTAILVSNTSSISITRLARYTPDPARFAGMHFFNPAPVMGLVEIIRGLATSPATLDAASGLARLLDKVAVHVSDSPGFVVNRLLIPMLNEAVFAVSEGIATVEGIDAAVKLGLNHPMGPLTLADFIGLDTCLEICRVLYSGTGDQKFRPAPLLVNYVEAGWLGRKAGRGFYDYSGAEPVPTR